MKSLISLNRFKTFGDGVFAYCTAFVIRSELNFVILCNPNASTALLMRRFTLLMHRFALLMHRFALLMHRFALLMRRFTLLMHRFALKTLHFYAKLY